MQLVTDITHFQSPEHTVLTIGTFDGIHIGHQRIITQVVERAKEQGLTPYGTDFLPSSAYGTRSLRSYCADSDHRGAGTTSGFLWDCAAGHSAFQQAICRTLRSGLCTRALSGKLRAKEIIIGYDHRFGKNRSAGIEELKAFGQQYHFQVEEIPVQEVDSLSVSSTKIRQALEKGDVQTANHYLGYSFSLAGTVVHGQKLGRTLGYPTANLQIENSHKLIPKIGVYAVYMLWEGKKVFGMLSIGKNPTIEGKGESIEVYFFDFSSDLYGKEIRLYFIDFIRDEVKFPSLEALKAQLKKDEDSCKWVIANAQ